MYVLQFSIKLILCSLLTSHYTHLQLLLNLSAEKKKLNLLQRKQYISVLTICNISYRSEVFLLRNQILVHLEKKATALLVNNQNLIDNECLHGQNDSLLYTQVPVILFPLS